MVFKIKNIDSIPVSLEFRCEKKFRPVYEKLTPVEIETVKK